MNAGFDAKQSVLIIHSTALILGGIGLIGHFAGAPEGLMFVIFLALFAIYMMVSKKFFPVQQQNRTELNQQG